MWLDSPTSPVTRFLDWHDSKSVSNLPCGMKFEELRVIFVQGLVHSLFGSASTYLGSPNEFFQRLSGLPVSLLWPELVIFVRGVVSTPFLSIRYYIFLPVSFNLWASNLRHQWRLHADKHFAETCSRTKLGVLSFFFIWNTPCKKALNSQYSEIFVSHIRYLNEK